MGSTGADDARVEIAILTVRQNMLEQQVTTLTSTVADLASTLRDNREEEQAWRHTVTKQLDSIRYTFIGASGAVTVVWAGLQFVRPILFP